MLEWPNRSRRVLLSAGGTCSPLPRHVEIGLFEVEVELGLLDVEVAVGLFDAEGLGDGVEGGLQRLVVRLQARRRVRHQHLPPIVKTCMPLVSPLC